MSYPHPANILTVLLSVSIALIAHTILAAEPLQEWQTVCENHSQTPLPAADLPSGKQRTALKECDAEALYYGIGIPADPRQARLCAYAQRATQDEEVFGSSGILMTIYANGIGAQRNLDLAIRFACEYGGAEAEMQSRIENLRERKRPHWQGKPFHLCDNITSGLMSGYCAAHDERIAAVARDRQIAAIVHRLTDTQHVAYERLRQTANQYFESHSDIEVDQSGTARAQFSIEARAKLEQQLLDMLDRLEQGKLPARTHVAFRQADAELNAVYRQIQHAKDYDNGTVTQAGIKSTQRAWLLFRDAWAAYVTARYPSVTRESILTPLTIERTMLLIELRP
ncbi:MAG: DUF1311 domain-containing protein [Gammaproteobacteria bacterium]|nr:DUF1311 domain-containing protein [Gammaproteobacteria bacterium]